MKEALYAQLDKTLLWFCSILSPIGDERELSEALANRLEKASRSRNVVDALGLSSPGSQASFRQLRRYGDSLVLPVSRQTGGPKIALVGHLDTVRTEHGPARIEHGRCYGAGASDMKAGLSIMTVLFEQRPDLAKKMDLTLVYYAREEGPYLENELGVVLNQDPELKHVDLAVCLEPSDNLLHLGCCGSLHARLSFRGRTAHSARPWEGENAISKASSFLSELAEEKPEESEIDGVVYRTVSTITQAKDGGRSRNVVPDIFELNLNHRFAPCYSIQDACEQVKQKVRGRAAIEFTDLSPSAMPNASHPLVQKLAQSGVRGVASKQAWTDVARFSVFGVAAVNFGPGENAQAHQKNESTSLALLHEGFDIFETWMNKI